MKWKSDFKLKQCTGFQYFCKCTENIAIIANKNTLLSSKTDESHWKLSLNNSLTVEWVTQFISRESSNMPLTSWSLLISVITNNSETPSTGLLYSALKDLWKNLLPPNFSIMDIPYTETEQLKKRPVHSTTWYKGKKVKIHNTVDQISQVSLLL